MACLRTCLTTKFIIPTVYFFTQKINILYILLRHLRQESNSGASYFLDAFLSKHTHRPNSTTSSRVYNEGLDPLRGNLFSSSNNQKRTAKSSSPISFPYLNTQ